MQRKGLLVFLLVSAIVGVCIPLANGAGATLEVWNSDASPAALEWYESVFVPAFEQKCPGFTAQVTKTPWGVNYNNKIVTSYAAGVGPDVIYGGAEYVDGFVESGFVVPLDEQVASWSDWKDFIPPTLGSVTYKGHVYGVPIFMDYRTVLINRQSLLGAGFDPDKPPATWDDFVAAAKRLTRRSDAGVEVQGMFVGKNYQDFNHMVWQNGGEILNETKTAPAFTSEAAIDALSFWIDAIVEVTGGAPQLGGGHANLVQGRITMVYQTRVPGFVQTARNAGMSEAEIAASIVPPLRRTRAQAGIYSNWIAVGSQSKHQSEAWEFIKLHLDLKNYTDYNRVNNGVPVRLSALRTDYVKANPWLVQALTLASTYGRATWTAMDFARLRDSLHPELNRAFARQATPRDALEAAAKAWNSILSETR